MVAAESIARTLQDALERWEAVVEPLQALYEGLNLGTASQALASDAVRFMAPLPRAWQWLDGSAFPQHALLMAEAFKHPPIETELPLMYQGLSHLFHGPTEDVPFLSEADGIDFEGEFGVLDRSRAHGRQCSRGSSLCSSCSCRSTTGHCAAMRRSR